MRRDIMHDNMARVVDDRKDRGGYIQGEKMKDIFIVRLHRYIGGPIPRESNWKCWQDMMESGRPVAFRRVYCRSPFGHIFNEKSHCVFCDFYEPQDF